MRRAIKITVFLLVVVSVVTLQDVYSDKQTLHDSVIRLHVVGASDDSHDQSIKLRVRDAVTAWLQAEMEGIASAEEARVYIRSHLEELEAVANQALLIADVDDSATVSFMEEEFPVRNYDTFSLPTGVYHSLRIRIGEAKGKNWWCVVFPAFCFGSSTQEFEDMAVSSGFDRTLTGALAGERQYEIRFFLLDCLGIFENFFHRG